MEGNAMKFEYKDDHRDGEPVAILYRFNGGPELCLGMKAQSGKSVWFYASGLPSVQSTVFSDTDIVKKFYPGDKITITF